MCTLAFYFQAFSHYPIVAAANRDESLTRPSAVPHQLWSDPWIYGGQDLLATGTWLGINEHHMLAAVLNRHTGHAADPTRRSRGLLCLDALKHASVRQAVDFVAAQPAAAYNPFNLVIADPTAAYVIYAHPTHLEIRPLSPGFHFLTNYDLDDPHCPRTQRSRAQVANIIPDRDDSQLTVPDICAQLHPLLATHAPDPDPRASVCIHLDGYGTCSSTVLAYSQSARRFHYAFASGSPCRSTYSDVTMPPGAWANQPPSTA